MPEEEEGRFSVGGAEEEEDATSSRAEWAQRSFEALRKFQVASHQACKAASSFKHGTK
jgi:hypothetical protein